MKLTFLQWNILYKENLDHVVELLNELKPDIFCLQELSVKGLANPKVANAADYIAEKTGTNHYFEEAQRWVDEGQAWNGDDELEAIGNGVFSRFPINDKSFKFIQKPTPSFTDYAHEGRVYVEGSVDVGSKILCVGTAHVSYTNEFEITAEKRVEVDNLLKIIDEKKSNYIFSGDLNSTPGSYTITELEKRLMPCGPDYSQNTWTTKPFEHQGFVADSLDWRLDYVFATPDVKILEARVVDTPYSDHLPVLVHFEL